MVTYLSPGVYVEELWGAVSRPPNAWMRPGDVTHDAIARIRPVGPSALAIIGYTERAPATDSGTSIPPGRPILVRSWDEYGGLFGGVVPGSYLPYCVQGFFANGGKRCYVISLRTTGHEEFGTDGKVSMEEVVGSRAERTALAGVEALDDVGYVCAPDLLVNEPRDNDGRDEVAAFVNAIIAFCERQRYCLAILDAPAFLQPEQVRGWREKMTYDSMHATLYYPWITVDTDGQSRTVPSCGHIAGVFVRTAENRGGHAVPANETIYGAIGLAYDVTRFEQDVLNPSGVNVLRRLPDSSIRIWGARTLASEPLFQNLKTRLILNVVDRSIEHGTSWAIFQQGSVLGEQLCLALYDFAEHLWRAGALVGETETEAFYISPTGRIGNEQRAIEVGLAIHRANEFVRVRVVYASDDVVPEISSEPVDQDVMTSAVNKRELAKASVPGHPKVFISYSRTDWDEFVAPLIALLAKNGFSAWIDQHLLRGGQDWMDKIDEALQSCSVMVLCLSPEAVSSKHVKYEYRYFFRNNKDILPLVCRPVRVPAELGGLQHLRYEQQEALIARLTELLGEHLRSE